MRIWSLVEEEETSLFSRQNGSEWARDGERGEDREKSKMVPIGIKDRVAGSAPHSKSTRVSETRDCSHGRTDYSFPRA